MHCLVKAGSLAEKQSDPAFSLRLGQHFFDLPLRSNLVIAAIHGQSLHLQFQTKNDELMETGFSISSRRIVILGASNVTFAFPMIADACLNSTTERPVELFAAHGHGRSYCSSNQVLFRELPSLNECGLWNRIQETTDASEKWALVTDAGNDLIYGRSVELVASQILKSLQQLHGLGYPITFVRPPLERILRLSNWNYRIIKKILFPGPTVPWPIISARVIELDQILCEQVEQLGARIVTPQSEWYGVDPIHIRGSRKAEAWTEILSTWPFEERPQVRWQGWNNALTTWKLAPEKRSLWGRERFTEQPAMPLPNESSLWQY